MLKPGRLSPGGDGRHSGDTLDRIPANGCLAREHQRVGAIKNSVGHIGRLGTGGMSLCHHRLKHLGGRDDRDGGSTTFGDNLLLGYRHLLKAHLQRQVTAGDHDPVGLFDDGIDVVESPLLFDLGDDGDIRAPTGE